MGPVLISAILAAGAGAFAYSKLGSRVGYGNSNSVWTLVGIVTALAFVVFMILFNTVVSLD